jgi:hypothetical protein
MQQYIPLSARATAQFLSRVILLLHLGADRASLDKCGKTPLGVIHDSDGTPAETPIPSWSRPPKLSLTLSLKRWYRRFLVQLQRQLVRQGQPRP